MRITWIYISRTHNNSWYIDGSLQISAILRSFQSTFSIIAYTWKWPFSFYDMEGFKETEWFIPQGFEMTQLWHNLEPVPLMRESALTSSHIPPFKEVLKMSILLRNFLFRIHLLWTKYFTFSNVPIWNFCFQFFS